MAPPKGKQATRGAKQIVEENVATINQYTTASGFITCINVLVYGLCFWSSLNGLYMWMTVLCVLLHIASLYFMSFMSQTTRGDDGTLLDSGTDLNMEAGMAEHAKDLIILTSATQLMSIGTTYAWLLLLLAPGRGVYMLWVYAIQPWLSSGPQEEEVNEKKEKKKERKMKRQQVLMRR